jgi:hypothetical protein
MISRRIQRETYSHPATSPMGASKYSNALRPTSPAMSFVNDDEASGLLDRIRYLTEGQRVDSPEVDKLNAGYDLGQERHQRWRGVLEQVDSADCIST